MSRGLAVPAVLCVAVGAILGVWGWGQRDEARARIVPEEQVIEGGGLFGSGPVDEAQRRSDACVLLLAASRVEPPESTTGPIAGLGPLPDDPDDPGAADALGFALSTVLYPDVVGGLPDLDRPDVWAAIEEEREAIDLARARGSDVTDDEDVARAAAALGQAIDGSC